MEKTQANPFEKIAEKITVGGQELKYYSLKKLGDPRFTHLPYSIRVLLECAVRNCDEFKFKTSDVEKILDWEKTSKQSIEIPFKPSRVLLQDFTGVPCVVDLAAMRDAMKKLGGDPDKINPACPVDLVIDHSVQVDFARTADARERNEEMEFNRNSERFGFLKWGQGALSNFQIVPPGSGIVHQVNLEYLARVVFNRDGLLYPDSLVGTDSHTTMIDALGVVGWGVGGIEAEAVMLGEAVSMVLPEVVGFKLIGSLPKTATATDLVLTATEMLRKKKVVEKFVEFFGPGVQTLTIADRATISNMSPEYGATMGFFPIDQQTLEYLQISGRTPEQLQVIEQYAKAQGLFRSYNKDADPDPVYTDVLELDLSTVVPCLSGPKRPQDRVTIAKMKADWNACLTNPVGFKGFGLTQEQLPATASFKYKDQEYTIGHGAVVIAAITSCTNTSNPDVMIAAGLVAKKAIEAGLSVKPYIKTSLSPGSGVVSKYFESADLVQCFNTLGFTVAGYGCMTCIGNSGELEEPVAEAIQKGDLVAAAVLSGNRNFEGRVHPLTRANYLASPPLVVAYALAGTTNIDFETEPVALNKDGKPVFLKDIWPSREEVRAVTDKHVKPEFFKDVYSNITKGNARWNALNAPTGKLFDWQEKSTYIHNPPFFTEMTAALPAVKDIKEAFVLLNLGDSITTDHISPAGNISKNSPAGKFLISHGVEQKDFNSYGARRGNDEIMARGTFANTRLKNKFLGGKEGPLTIHVPTGETLPVFEASERYIKAGQPTIILAGQEYGSGSSRDWAAKGPYLLGVKAVIAQSYERIHRSNLVGMGVLPTEFLNGESAECLGLTGKEQFTINLGELKTNQELEVVVSTGKKFKVRTRLDTDVEIEYFKNGGILHYVLRKLALGGKH